MPRVPLTWLAESVDLVPGSTAEDVATALVRVGLEEEGIHGSDVTGPLVVGRVLSLAEESHTNGKTISYCRVDVGGHNDAATDEYPASRGIVCGAHNFVEGDLVVVALPGAVLPGPFPITVRKTYGHVSDGMICSQRELGLGDDHTGIIVLTRLGFSATGSYQQVLPFDRTLRYEPHFVGPLQPGADALPLLGIDEKTVEVNVTPDRGYCFSIRGVAREYSHATGQPFRDRAALAVPAPTAGGFAVQLDDAAPIRGRVGCDRFVARIVRGIDVSAESPAWMTRRLTQAGMRPISLAVDVTNYVMLELGQPLHAYDLAKVSGPIVVRRAEAGEKLTTLDDVVRTLDAEDLLITDSPGGARASRVLGLAGVMGGASSEVSETTTDLLLEGAHFDPVSIARTARRHKLGSEASRRFERGVDTALAPHAVQRAIDLLVEFGGGRADAEVTDVDHVPAAAPIEMPVALPARIVGMPYTADEVHEVLTRIGCEVTGSEALTVLPPTWRPDLDSPIDLVEEVARLHGYEQLPSALPVAPSGRGLTHSQRVRRSVARALAERGLTEVLTYPFIAPERLDELQIPAADPRRDPVRLVNPLSEAQPLLRTSLLQTLVDAVTVNLSRGTTDLAVFEIGRAYRADGSGRAPRPGVGGRPADAELEALDAAIPSQPRRVAGILVGNRVPSAWDAKAEPFEWSDAVAAALVVARIAGVEVETVSEAAAPWHPGRCATFRLADGTFVGHAGELHPKVLETVGLPKRAVAFELVLDPLIDASDGTLVAATPVLTQPLAKEDLAFVVDESVTARDLVATVRAASGDVLEDARVFDVYRGEQVGEGKKSVAVTVRLRAADHTLSAAELAAVRNAIIAAAESKLGAVLR